MGSFSLAALRLPTLVAYDYLVVRDYTIRQPLLRTVLWLASHDGCNTVKAMRITLWSTITSVCKSDRAYKSDRVYVSGYGLESILYGRIEERRHVLHHMRNSILSCTVWLSRITPYKGLFFPVPSASIPRCFNRTFISRSSTERSRIKKDQN